MTRTGTIITAASVLLALAVPAADARTRTDQPSGVHEQRSGDWRQISGTIKQIKEVEVRGQDQDNLVVQLQTERGRKTVVDLGNAEKIEDLDLQKGDRLSAWGRTVNIGDKRVFMAHKIEANNERIDVDRRQVAPNSMRQGSRTGDHDDLSLSHEDRSQNRYRGRQSADRY
jgi:hypothetical protein